MYEVIYECKIVDNNNIGSDKVDVFHSRDLDSRPSARESFALDQFHQTEKAMFHLMRDHKEHMAPVLGKAHVTQDIFAHNIGIKFIAIKI